MDRTIKIPGYDGKYLLHEGGYVTIENNFFNLTEDERRVKTEINKNGDLSVTLYKKSTKKVYALSILMLKLFVGPKPKGKRIFFEDNDKTNCSLDNLRYVPKEYVRPPSFPENSIITQKMIDRPYVARGENHVNTHLTDEQVGEIKAALQVNGGIRGYRKFLARKYGISPGVISKICKSKSWAHIPVGK